MSLFESKGGAGCGGACDGCKSWGAGTVGYSGEIHGVRLAGWSALVFLLPLVTGTAGALGFRGWGPSAGAAAGVLGLGLGALAAWAIFHGARRERPAGVKQA
jgi:hypothetical protein